MLVGGGKDPLPGFVDLPQQLRKAPEGLGPEDQIHVAVGLPHPLCHPLLLGHAAAEDDDLLRVLLLGMGQDAQVAEDPLLRVLPDGAGVQQGQIRLPRVLRKGEAAGLQHAHEPLAVRHVLLTAVGLHKGPGMGPPGGEHGLDLRLKVPLAGDFRLRDHNFLSLQNASSICADACLRLQVYHTMNRRKAQGKIPPRPRRFVGFAGGKRLVFVKNVKSHKTP